MPAHFGQMTVVPYPRVDLPGLPVEGVRAIAVAGQVVHEAGCQEKPGAAVGVSSGKLGGPTNQVEQFGRRSGIVRQPHVPSPRLDRLLHRGAYRLGIVGEERPHLVHGAAAPLLHLQPRCPPHRRIMIAWEIKEKDTSTGPSCVQAAASGSCEYRRQRWLLFLGKVG
jgi:hypothetical protein